MSIREVNKIVQIGERKWQISKFDALTGSYITVKMLSRVMHIISAVLAGQVTDPILIGSSVATEIGNLSKAEFNEIQYEALSVIKEIKTIGGKEIPAPLRLPDGQWGVEGVADNAMLILALVTHSLVFNLMGFFEEKELKEVINSFSDLNLFGAKTLTNTPSPR